MSRPANLLGGENGSGRSGASIAQAGLGKRLKAWGVRHLQTFFYALGQLSQRPLSALMTAAVIGIALALPAELHVVLKNVQRLLSGWDGATQVSLFLKHDVSEKSATIMAERLRAKAGVGGVDYVSRQQAMDEFRLLSGFGEALEALEDNPLPAVLVVRPTLSLNTPVQVQGLLDDLKRLPEVDLAQLDMQWVKRLYALMDIGRRAVWVLAGLLALAVLLVVGNTIRLAIQNRRDEIVITKLIGATDPFIRRPFLYTGFWYGLIGGLIALALVAGSLAILAEPIHALAGLYHSDFRLDTFDLATSAALLAAGTLLGLAGSWLAVGRHLRDIEPT